MFGFGGNRAKELTKDMPTNTFADVAGADEAVDELQEIKDFLQDPSRYEALGAKIPRGVLLYGPPGTGKTLLARAVAGEAGVPFYSISGSDFVEMFVGVAHPGSVTSSSRLGKTAPALSLSTRLMPWVANAAPAWAAATMSGNKPSTSCLSRWMASAIVKA